MHFVDMWELERGVGKRLAELSGAESGMVTAGAAAAMATATAACLAGTDPAKIWQLPDTTGMKHEVIMFGGRISFDNAIRAVGGKLVVVYSHDDLKSALNENTAMVYTTARGEMLEKAIPITKAAKIPILVDWAAGIPPIENLGAMEMGADSIPSAAARACGPHARVGAVPQGPYLSGVGAELPVGRSGLPGDEGWQGRNHGPAGRGGSLEKIRPRGSG
jgi:L-seryl-tRNA(Ser) seleniumtransferase